MTDVAKFLGADNIRIEELALSFKFELDLLRIYYDSKEVDGRNSTVHEMSVKKMIESWPNIDWIKFLNLQTYPYYTFTNDTKIYVESPNFITYYEQLLIDTPKRVQANYAIWKLIKFVIPYINSKTLFYYYQTYRKSNDSSYSINNDDFDCDVLTETSLNDLLHAFYIRKYPVDKRTQSGVHKIFSNVKNKLINVISLSKWLDKNVKNLIIDKIASIKTVLGYPDELLNNDELQNYFEGLVITRNNFLKNYFNTNSFNHKKKLFALFYKANEVKNGMELYTLLKKLENNAFYYGSDHFIGTRFIFVQ